MYIDFISVENYAFYYISIIFIVAVISFLQIQSISVKGINKSIYLKVVPLILLIFIVVYMGLRPLDEKFGDMIIYNYHFKKYVDGATITTVKDALFHSFIKLCSTIMTANMFFLLCAFIYVYPLYVVSKKWFKEYWFYAFLMLVGSFSFWAYGANGIRNGIATSLFLLALSRDKYIFQALFFFLAVSFHKSMLLPLLGYLLTFINNNVKYYLLVWLLSILLSFLLPGFWEGLFASFVEDDRTTYLLNSANSEKFSSTGFRWDFLLYSSSGILIGYYFAFREKFKDKFYNKLFNLFLFANAFWILVIRANFSNRFAYLSWFILAIIIAYPFLNNKTLANKHKKIAIAMLLYIGFTYGMSLISNVSL